MFLLLLNYINCLKYNVKFDYYYEVLLKEYNGNSTINVKDIYNQNIINITKESYGELLYTGTGILPNGTIINLYKDDKFEYVNTKYKYTLGNNNNELIPNKSISTNMFGFGTYIYIKYFNKNGLGLITDDGCFRVDDNNGENNKITIFTGDIPIHNKYINKKIEIYPDFCTFS